MSDGDTARRYMEEAINYHPSKDSRSWYIRDRVEVSGGWNNVDTEIIPKISPLEAKEGLIHGQTVENGDVKITVPGDTGITAGMTLVATDGVTINHFNVYYVNRQFYDGICIEERCFVRPIDRSLRSS